MDREWHEALHNEGIDSSAKGQCIVYKCIEKIRGGLKN